MNAALSPQAARRLVASMSLGELRDLVHDVAEALEADSVERLAGRRASSEDYLVLGEDERAVILAVFMRGQDA